ncbi:hypothetical protein Tco_1524476 [Tanacetum coccineum]
MQAEEQEKLSIEEKSKLFVQLLEARKKYFAAIRAQEKRNKPPTKAQKRNTTSTYLKNMARYKHNQLKNKSFNDIQKLFDKAMKRVNTFVDMDTKLVEGSEVRAEGSETRAEGSSKRAGEELEHEKAKKQKVDEDREHLNLKDLWKSYQIKKKLHLMLFLWLLNLLALFTSTQVVPIKETTIKSVLTPTQGIKVYSRRPKATKSVVQIVLWYLDSECSKHMTENRSELTNFVNKFLGTVKFGNDQISKIIGYSDYQMENVTISRVYYVEGLGHNLFSVG